MSPRVPNQRRPHEETVAIVFDTRAVVVVMQAALDRVALANEVLTKEICDVDVLMPGVKPVQAAVGIFLEHREEGAVVLVEIVVQRSKEARAQIIVGKNKAPKIGNKRLDTG